MGGVPKSLTNYGISWNSISLLSTKSSVCTNDLILKSLTLSWENTTVWKKNKKNVKISPNFKKEDG